jgi:hypothetical protein
LQRKSGDNGCTHNIFYWFGQGGLIVPKLGQETLWDQLCYKRYFLLVVILKSVYKQGLRRAEQSPTQTTFKCCYAIPFFMYIMDQIDIFCKHAGISHSSLKESLVLVNFPSQLVVSGFKTKNIENNHCQHMSSSHCAKPNQLYASLPWLESWWTGHIAL